MTCNKNVQNNKYVPKDFGKISSIKWFNVISVQGSTEDTREVNMYALVLEADRGTCLNTQRGTLCLEMRLAGGVAWTGMV